jgi:hypothetical protein
MKGTLPRYVAKVDVEADQPLLKEEHPLEKDTPPERTWRLPSLQKIFNALSLIYILLSIPMLLKLYKPQISQPYCQ